MQTSKVLTLFSDASFEMNNLLIDSPLKPLPVLFNPKRSCTLADK